MGISEYYRPVWHSLDVQLQQQNLISHTYISPLARQRGKQKRKQRRSGKSAGRLKAMMGRRKEEHYANQRSENHSLLVV